jgi:hypothetical protein
MTVTEEKMRQSFLLGISLLAVSVCAPQPAPAQNNPPPTTTYYDGSYVGEFVQTTPRRADVPCPDIRIAPALTIRNGVANFAALDLTFQGYVTPDGAVSMRSEGGQTFQGQFDAYYQLRGQVVGRCVYDATWHKQRAPGPKTN